MILRHRLGYSPQVLRRAVLSLALAFAIVADRGCGSAAAAAVFEPPRVVSSTFHCQMKSAKKKCLATNLPFTEVSGLILGTWDKPSCFTA